VTYLDPGAAWEVLEDTLGLRLAGPDGNAWAILGATRGYLKDAGFEPEAITSLMEGARSGDYEHLLKVCAEALLET
jgi:hypothetical protein